MTAPRRDKQASGSIASLGPKAHPTEDRTQWPEVTREHSNQLLASSSESRAANLSLLAYVESRAQQEQLAGKTSQFEIKI